MSKVVSFKVPEDMAEEIDKAVKEGSYQSRGEFLRALIRNLERKKLSEKAKRDIEEARKQEGRPIDELLGSISVSRGYEQVPLQIHE